MKRAQKLLLTVRPKYENYGNYMKRTHSKIVTLCIVTLLLAGASANAALVDILGTLGAASKYTVLSLSGTFQNDSLVTINGDVGVGPNGSVNVAAPSVINGTLFKDPTASFSGSGKISGGVVTTSLGQAVNDAINASNIFAGLSPTQMLSSISSAITITGNGGNNVITLSGGINLGGSNNLTLSGNANDRFIFNISGGLEMNGSAAVVLTGGVLPQNVVFNFIGAGPALMTHVGNMVVGVVLAPQRDITFHGAFGEIIGGGSTLTLMSGATVTGFNVPEVTPSSVIFGFIGLVVAFGSRRTLMAKVRAS
jgi:hypothetical protein